jgi:hypothetical protein
MKNLKLITLAAVLAAAVLPASAAAKLAPPALVGPANGATFQELPTLSWGAVRGAAQYEYEISGDPRFHSIIGAGPNQGATRTYNLAATLPGLVPDGHYSWRVRGLTSKGTAGRWSRVRTLTKSWSATPAILGTAGSVFTWPSAPLVLHWSSVPYAVKYIVTIATDPALTNQVIGSPATPLYTDGTSFVPPGTLANGTYYWAVTPVDADSQPGVRSAVATFTWTWPTTTTTGCVVDLMAGSCPAGLTPVAEDPSLSWGQIAGAAKYDVEINASPQFPAGSKWCCTTPTIGTTLAPQQSLANNSTYWWRVRALDSHGNAGQWNYGTSWTEEFDDVTPSIHNLTLRDVNGNAIPGLAPATDTPIVTWDPVPGASRYEVEVGYWNGANCDYGAFVPPYKVETAATSWTPYGNNYGQRPGSSAWPTPQYDPNGPGGGGSTYCVSVAARADNDAQGGQVVGAPTYLNATDDPNQPSFTFSPPPAITGQTFQPFAPSGTYILPANGSSGTRTPLLTWNWLPGANGYFVVTSRDASFTDIADVGYTDVPAYSPRLANSAPLADKSTAYYWAVIPVHQSQNTLNYNPAVLSDHPVTFNKSSVPPAPLGPADGAQVSTWPTFSWTPAENARNYTLEVSADPSFGNPIDNVTTDATQYTSSTTYPADTTLYWRVRGNDWIGQGLNWSAVRTFKRELPTATPSPENALAGELEPVLSWSLVPGAIAYDFHVTEGTGVSQDWTVDSPSVTPTSHQGIGRVRWQVRPLFPTIGAAMVGGGFSAPEPYLLQLGPPPGAHGTRSGARIIISWKPDPAAKRYEVDVASTDSFTGVVSTQRVEGTSWAPSIDYALPGNGGRLYWRVAAISSDGVSVGAFATGSFAPPRHGHRRAGHAGKHKHHRHH